MIKNESLEIEFDKTEETYKIVFGSNGKAITGKDAGDKVKATKTNDPDIDVTYKWSDKKSEAGWTWTGETKEM